MANGWGEMETVINSVFLGSKNTADGDCNFEIKRCLLLGRKAMTNLDSILKSQDKYFTDKRPYNQNYGFSSSHVGRCESWIIKKAEHQELMLSSYGAGEDS